jgi:hypothetical protein
MKAKARATLMVVVLGGVWGNRKVIVRELKEHYWAMRMVLAA